MLSLAALLSLATTTFAGDIRPYAMLRAGLTIPSVEMEGSGTASGMNVAFGNTDPVKGFTVTTGFGVRAALTPRVDFDGSAGFTFASVGLESDATLDGQLYTGGTNYDLYAQERLESTFSPRLLDLDGGILFHATPTFALGGGGVFSLPLGGDYEMKATASTARMCPTGGSCVDITNEVNNANSTQTSSIKNDAAFLNLKAMAEFTLGERLGMDVLCLFPLGDYYSETADEEFGGKVRISFARAMVGFRYLL